MRILFFILGLANVVFFAYAWFGAGAQASGDEQIIGQQLNPEKIRLLAPEQVSALTRKPEPPKAACLEWGALAAGDVARAEQALEPLAFGAKLSQRKQEDAAGFWVYIAPLSSRQVATQKAAELKRLGVEEYFVVPDDPKWRNAISLGVFKTEDAAKARLAALRAKGVKSAAAGPRGPQPDKTYFQVREASPALAAKLNELKQGFPGTDVRECAAEEKKG
ncbi:MAG: SPOR domain-containing protein [Betaproteobacteria bacterium]|nr:SPOR domain-containing protein [Betaproteobacteria bacterium]